MGFLDDLKKLAQGSYHQVNPFDNGRTFDTNSRGAQPAPTPPPGEPRRRNFVQKAFDQVNPVDQNRTWKMPTPQGPNRNIGQQLWNTGPTGSLIQSGDTALKHSVNTVGALSAGVIGLGDAGWQSLFGTDKSYQDALTSTDAAMKELLNHGWGNKGGFGSYEDISSNDFKRSFVKPVTRGVAEVGPFVIPVGKVVPGSSLLTKAAVGGAENAAVGGGATAANQWASGQPLDKNAIIKSAATSAALGAAMPVGGAVLKGAVEKAGPKVTAAVDAAKPSNIAANHPAVQAINDHLATLNKQNENLSALGLSEKNPARIANAKAYASALEERARTMKSVSEGGYIQVPGKKAPAPAEIPTELQPLADNISSQGASLKEFKAAIEKGLKNQNLTKRETVQKTLAAINDKYGNADDFHAAVTGKNLSEPVSVGEILQGNKAPKGAKVQPAEQALATAEGRTALARDNLVQDSSLPTDIAPTQIKVKGPMTPEQYRGRYGKEPPAGANIKVKPFTPDDYAFNKWEDKSALGLNRETLERNLDRVAGKDAPAVKKFLVDASRNNETARANFLNDTKGRIRKDIVEGLGIKAKSQDAALVQKFGEKQPGIDEAFLIKSVGPERAANIVKASEYFRNEYDTILDKWNAVRAKYGYAPVPKRADYFRHFQDISNTINQVGMVLRQEDLPTTISGLTDMFQPGKPFSTAELARRGGKTAEDAIAGMNNYLDNVSRQIYHLDTVQRGRTLEKMIRKSAEAAPEEVKLPNFVANLQEWTNGVSGKKSRMDRAAEAFVGRKIYGATNALRSQTGANMVGANLSSAMSNFIPFTQSIATTSKPAFVRGIMDTLASPFKGKLTEIDGQPSGFLTRRYQQGNIDVRGVQHASELASTPFKTVDEFTSRSIVAGKYYEAIKEGLSPKDAMAMADDYASRVLTDRSIGQTPNLFNVKTVGFLNQFQTEINNQVSYLMRDIPMFAKGNPVKIANSLAQFTIFSYLFNSAYQQVTGQRPQLDPIHAVLNLTGNANPDADTGTRIKQATEDIAGGLPFTSIFTGGRLPVNAMLPDVGALKSGVQNAVSGEGPVVSELYKGLSGPLFYGLPPFGGGQAKKIIEGANTQRKGYSETPAGRVRFEQDGSAYDKLRGLLFGQYATDEGQKYIQGGAKPLGDQQSELFKALNPADRGTYMERMAAERSDAKTVAAAQSAADKGKSAPSGGGSPGNGIIQLKSGKFTAKIGNDYKTFDSSEEAQTAIDKGKVDQQVTDFKKSDKKTTTIGDDYYYKTKSGDVKSMSKGEYDWNQTNSKLNLDLDRKVAANDLEGWLNAAQSKYDALEKKKDLYDPETEADKINSITLEQENLKDKANGYLEKGYIRKTGSKGKKAWKPPTRSTSASDAYSALRSLLKSASVT